MAKFSIESTRGKVKDIQGNIDSKKTELNNLEQRKQEIMEAHNDIDSNSKMDEHAQQVVFESLAQERQRISEKAEGLSKELDSDASMLEEMGQEVDDSTSDTESERKKLEQLKSTLDPIGLGASLEGGLSEMDDSLTSLQDLRTSITEASREVRNLQTQLGNL